MKEELRKLTETINKQFNDYRAANDQRLEEMETRTVATAETTEKLEKIENDLQETRTALNEALKKMNRPKVETRSGQEVEVTEEEMEHRSAFISYMRHGLEDMPTEEKRALSSASDADGGFLVPPSFESGIIMAAYDLAEFRPLAQVGTTGRDTVYLGALSKPSVAWGRANLAVSATDLNAGARRLAIHDLRALVLIHNNTLDDSDADIIGEIQDAFGRACAEAEDDAFLVGAGDDNPMGVMMNTTIQANVSKSGVAAALSDASNNGMDALLGCYYKVKKGYRKNGTFFFNSNTEAVIRKLKDGDSRYLWQPPVIAGDPPTLLGRPVINPEGMADIAANAFPIGFGDIRAGYKIRDRQGLVVTRLPERYAEYDQTGFIVKKRVGGMVTLAEAFSCVKISA